MELEKMYKCLSDQFIYLTRWQKHWNFKINQGSENSYKLQLVCNISKLERTYAKSTNGVKGWSFWARETDGKLQLVYQLKTKNSQIDV